MVSSSQVMTFSCVTLTIFYTHFYEIAVNAASWTANALSMMVSGRYS